MPVTIYPSEVTPNIYYWGEPASSASHLLKRSCPDQKSIDWVIQSSFRDSDFTNGEILCSKNGFVHAALEAYNTHHHLRIRPEDVWFSILTQLSFYINRHAEELREKFVAHQGQKLIYVEMPGTVETSDYAWMADQMTSKLEEHLVDKSLKKWIIPDFTTTQDDDKTVAAIIMMGALQAYFKYGGGFTCGLPSVTLLGERGDWKKIHDNLERISSWGDEPREFADRLKVVVGYFIRSFDDPSDSAVKDFWNRIAKNISRGSGSSDLSGWMTAFCFWSKDGNIISTSYGGLSIDNTYFTSIDRSEVPNGYISVPVQLTGPGFDLEARMVAGSVGIRATCSGKPAGRDAHENTNHREIGLDTLQGKTGWWIYEMPQDPPRE